MGRETTRDPVGIECLAEAGASEDRLPARGYWVPVMNAAALDCNSHAVLSGIGIAMLPSVVCSADVRAGSLRAVLPDAPPPAVPIWVSYSGGRHISPAVRAFVDFAKEHFVKAVEGRHYATGFEP